MSFDPVAANALFAVKNGFPFRLLSDTEREAGILYGACEDRGAATAKRISYLIDPDGRILRAYPAVKAAEHPREVLGDLRTYTDSRTGG